jgi:sodium/bile acid cotransporter 7
MDDHEAAMKIQAQYRGKIGRAVVANPPTAVLAAAPAAAASQVAPTAAVWTWLYCCCWYFTLDTGSSTSVTSCWRYLVPFTDKASFIKWHQKRFFNIYLIVAILLALAYPDAGAKGGKLNSKVSTGWVAVVVIFVISGWSLKTRELVKAALYCKLNTVVQVFNLGVIPVVFYGVTRALTKTNMNSLVVEGMLIFSCLPTTVSMCVGFTAAANGNNAAAIFNAAFGNCLGIIATPTLVLLYVGNKSTVPFAEVLIKLTLKVFVPLCVGQAIQYAGARQFYLRHKKRFGRGRDIALLCIIYTTFCQTFYTGYAVGAGDIIAILVIEVALYILFCGAVLWVTGIRALRFSRADRVAMLYCGTHKTVAMGIPLLNTMFEGNPDLGLYIVPLIIYHPMQSFIGGFIQPKLAEWVLADPENPPKPEDSSAAVAKTTKLQDVEKRLEEGRYNSSSQK